MSFEYIKVDKPSPPAQQQMTSFALRVARLIHRKVLRDGQLETIHGNVRVSCRPLSAAECAHMGLQPTMRVEHRFAVHVEGVWRVRGETRAPLVLDVYGGGQGALDAASAYLASNRKYINLDGGEIDLVKREVLAALELVSARR
jgi:hypothetical protein